VRWVRTLGDFQPRPHLGVGQTWELEFEGTRQLGDDDELPSPSFDGRDHFAIEEAHIGADPDLTHRRRGFGKAGREQLYGSMTGMHIAGTQLPGPEIWPLGLEANPGMIRRTTMHARVVTDAGLPLVPAQREHRRVEVEDDAPSSLGALPEFRQQAVVDSTQFGQSANRQSAQEASQRGGIGIGRQTRESLGKRRCGAADPLH